MALVDRALAGTDPHRIVHLHGPGGVGKSAIVREVQRRAAEGGRTIVALDGRTLTPQPGAIEAAVAPAAAEHALLVIDEVDELESVRFELRSAIVSVLSATAVVVLAGRRTPDPRWFEDGLEHLSTSVAVAPLSTTEARDLLARHGLNDAATVDPLVGWAAGYPLALTVAASLQASASAAGAEPPPPTTHRVGAGTTLDDVLLERLGGQEMAGVDPDVLDVAAIAPAVDARLLAAVLPGRPTRAGIAQLRALSIAEPLGTRTTLHRLARAALRSRLKDSDPDRYRTLVLRVADHLRMRALTEGQQSLLELADLVENPALRLGFDPGTRYYADVPRPGDVDVAAAFTGAGDTAWFGRFRRWCEDHPQQVMSVRRATGELAALTVIVMSGEAPAWATETIEIGPVLDHAAVHSRVAEAAFMHDLVVLEDPSDPEAIAEVIRVGNAGAIRRGSIRDPRYIYVTAPARREDDGTVLLGYEHIAELDRGDDERRLVTIMSDFGPDGATGQVFGLIQMEQQAPPEDAAPAGRGLALVAALRSFNDDDALAGSPLADRSGDADAVRAEVRRAIDVAFGESDSEADALLRLAIERTYLDVDGGHGIAQRELHMSRSSFYRHLQRAREQLVTRAAADG